MAVRNYDVWKQRMSYAARNAFKPQRTYTEFEDLFSIVGHKVTRIIAIWGELAQCAAGRTSFVMVPEAVGSFFEDGLI